MTASPAGSGNDERQWVSTTPVYRRILALGLVLVLVVAIVGGITGFLVSGGAGVASALIGAALALLLISASSLSVLFANRYLGSQNYANIFFGTVLGGWLVKFVVFIAVVLILRDQPWLDRGIFFGSVVVAVLGALIIDFVVLRNARIPNVSDLSPGR